MDGASRKTSGDEQKMEKRESQPRSPPPPPPPPPPPATYPLFDVIAIVNFAPLPPPLRSDNKTVKMVKDGEDDEKKESYPYNHRHAGRGRQVAGSSLSSKVSSPRSNAGGNNEEKREHRPRPPVLTPQPKKNATVSDRLVSSMPPPSAYAMQIDAAFSGKKVSKMTSGDMGISSSNNIVPSPVGRISKSTTGSTDLNIENVDRKHVGRTRTPINGKSSIVPTNLTKTETTSRSNQNPRISATNNVNEKILPSQIAPPVNSSDGNYNESPKLNAQEIKNGTVDSSNVKDFAIAPPELPISGNNGIKNPKSILKPVDPSKSYLEESSSEDDDLPVPMTKLTYTRSVGSSEHSRSVTDLIAERHRNRQSMGNGPEYGDGSSESESDSDSSRVTPLKKDSTSNNSVNNSISSSIHHQGTGRKSSSSVGSRDSSRVGTSRSANRVNSPTKIDARTMRMMMSSMNAQFDPLKHRLKTYVLPNAEDSFVLTGKCGVP